MEKPLKIIELEESYNVNFIEVFNAEKLIESNYYTNTQGKFLLNEDKIIGLSIYYCEIDDFSIFNKFLDLKFLDLAYNKIKKISNIDISKNLIWLDLNNNEKKNFSLCVYCSNKCIFCFL